MPRTSAAAARLFSAMLEHGPEPGGLDPLEESFVERSVAGLGGGMDDLPARPVGELVVEIDCGGLRNRPAAIGSPSGRLVATRIRRSVGRGQVSPTGVKARCSITRKSLTWRSGGLSRLAITPLAGDPTRCLA
jgi:hypothetical protein